MAVNTTFFLSTLRIGTAQFFLRQSNPTPFLLIIFLFSINLQICLFVFLSGIPPHSPLTCGKDMANRPLFLLKNKKLKKNAFHSSVY